MHREIVLFSFILVLLIGVGSCVEPLPSDTVADPGEPPAPDITGLHGSYYDSSTGELLYDRVDSRIDFFWSREGTEPLSPPEFFSVVWDGRLVPETSGEYQFHVFGDDGVRLYINGENVLGSDAWSVWPTGVGASDRVFSSTTLSLEAGVEYPIRLEFFQYDWNAQVQLNWSRAGGANEVVPSRVLQSGSRMNIPAGVPRGYDDAPDDMSTPQQPTQPVEPAPPEPIEGPSQTVTYTLDRTTDFMNPERGWLSHVMRPGDLPAVRNRGHTVAWTSTYEGSTFRLDDYRDSPISQAKIDEIESFFNTAREHGIKVKARFTYNGNPNLGPDASEERIVQHIRQLAPILERHEDIIAMLDAGFVGAWAEWHSSDHGLTDNTASGRAARARITAELLDALPESRMIGHRYPALLTEIYGEPGYIERDEYFSGSDQSRVGWLNDCFLMGRSNVGTYNTWQDPQPQRFNDERLVFERMGPYAVASAETCSSGGGLSEYNTCEASIREMELMSGPDLLNSAYWQGVYDRWRTDGCYDEISTRLGYRLALTSATLPTNAARGEAVSVSFSMENSGFGKVYNPRPLELVLRGPVERRITLYEDARGHLPLGGESTTITRTITIPSDLPAGTYSMHLALPDASPNLRGDARYSIRLANQNVWGAGRGTNDLQASITIV